MSWAQVADDLGYADQSHLIAEFRELAGLTPEMLARRPWFHPFILEAQSRTSSSIMRLEQRHGTQLWMCQ